MLALGIMCIGGAVALATALWLSRRGIGRELPRDDAERQYKRWLE